MSALRLALTILIFCARANSVSNHQFEQFYLGFEGTFASIIANNCSSLFNQYKNIPDTAIEEAYGACYLVVDCVLSNTAESIKANMASANVLLGLLPTILSLLGSTTPELALLSSRRPLLAFLLSIGAPTVSPVRTFMFHDPVAVLREGPKETIRHTKFQKSLIVLVQYLGAGAAISNVLTVSWQMGRNTVLNTSCGTVYWEMMWVGLAAVVHFFGTLAFTTRSRTKYVDDKPEGTSFSQRMRAWAKRWPGNEFSPCSTHTTHIFSWRKENNWFLIISWCVSWATVCHIVFGTATFSAAMFIGKFLMLSSNLYLVI
jgi:hypothetical protein